MKALIIENEKVSADRLIRLIREVDESIEIVAQLGSVSGSIDYLMNNSQPDLIFMDIELNDGQSFEIFGKIPLDIDSHIIFTTAFTEFSLKAFKFNSVDYLLKPVCKNELKGAINKSKRWLGALAQMKNVTLSLDEKQDIKSKYKSRFLIKKGKRFISIQVSEVAFFYVQKRLSWVKLKSGVEYVLDSRLDDLEKQLDPEMFYRANRQFMISYTAIDKIESWFDGKLRVDMVPVSQETVIISRSKANGFKQWLGYAIERSV